jgi:hypothetical protein
MITELLEKFEDIFQPHDKEELDKRLFTSIVGIIQDWAGDEKVADGVSAEQIKSVLNAIAMSEELEYKVNEYVKEVQEDYMREFRDTHPEMDWDEED